MRMILAALIIVSFCSLTAWAQDQAQTPAVAPPPVQNQNAAPAAAPTPAPDAAKPGAQSPSPSLENQPADTMPRKYVEVWNTGNFDHLLSIFSPPISMVSRGNRILLKPEILKTVVTAWRKAMPDLNFKIENTVIQGDFVVMRLRFTGTYKERLFSATAAPTPDAPRIVHATEMLMFHLKDGKIHEIWEEYDEMRMRYQMGGMWRTDADLKAAAAAGAPPSKPAPDEAQPAPDEEQPAAPPPKP